MSYYDYRMCRVLEAANLIIDYLEHDYHLDSTMQEQMKESFVIASELKNGLDVIHSVLLDRL